MLKSQRSRSLLIHILAQYISSIQREFHHIRHTNIDLDLRMYWVEFSGQRAKFKVTVTIQNMFWAVTSGICMLFMTHHIYCISYPIGQKSTSLWHHNVWLVAFIQHCNTKRRMWPRLLQLKQRHAITIWKCRFACKKRFLRNVIWQYK